MVIMDEGFALPCYQNIGKTINLLSQEAVMTTSGKDVDLSSLCPQFVPDGLLLTLQVHGDRNSMMQNITYSPVDQDPCVPFL